MPAPLELFAGGDSIRVRDNPATALVFGAWLRRTEYTADRVGLLCVPTVEDAIDAIAITNFHTLARRIDKRVLAEQQREIEADGMLVGFVRAAARYLVALVLPVAAAEKGLADTQAQPLG
ncbi:MAG: hypothetical protein ACREM8_05990 [Vulcanimicrobiaceae bacterium]